MMGKPNLSATRNETEITLGLLTVVESDSRATQRLIAGELGIALGLANAYLKRCVKKGYIKVTEAPAKRYAYYLTPTGFAEKSRLTAEYLSVSFNFFREARRQCSEMFAAHVRDGSARILLCGASDLVEIAILCAANQSIELVGVVDAGRVGPTFAGLPLFADIESAPAADAIAVTDLETPQETFDRLVATVPEGRVIAPRFLNISRRQAS
jgi:DNA-binding MarR family transcriptional regulator